MRNWQGGCLAGVAGLMLAACGPAGAQVIRPIGPAGGDVQALTALPGGTATIYFGTPGWTYLWIDGRRRAVDAAGPRRCVEHGQRGDRYCGGLASAADAVCQFLVAERGWRRSFPQR